MTEFSGIPTLWMVARVFPALKHGVKKPNTCKKMSNSPKSLQLFHWYLEFNSVLRARIFSALAPHLSLILAPAPTNYFLLPSILPN